MINGYEKSLNIILSTCGEEAEKVLEFIKNIPDEFLTQIELGIYKKGFLQRENYTWRYFINKENILSLEKSLSSTLKEIYQMELLPNTCDAHIEKENNNCYVGTYYQKINYDDEHKVLNEDFFDYKADYQDENHYEFYIMREQSKNFVDVLKNQQSTTRFDYNPNAIYFYKNQSEDFIKDNFEKNQNFDNQNDFKF